MMRRTQPISTRIDYRSSEAYELSAVRSLTRRDFPPETLAIAQTRAFQEMTETLNPERRHRSYPRVVKRHFAKYHKIKRPKHQGRRYPSGPKIHIYNIKSLT
jgi:hypothetical protein